MTPPLRWLLLVLGGLWAAWSLSGDVARSEYVGRGLDVEQQSWDTLRVVPRLVRRTVLAGSRPVRPDSVRIYVFDASYDLVGAVTHDGTVPPPVLVPDDVLGDRERLTVEACGYVRARPICEQQSVRASPKRLRALPEIDFPESDAFRKGRYRLRFAVERQLHGDTTWTPIELAGRPGGYLQAYVQGRPAESVRIPLRGTQGRFDLARHAGYEDFDFYLRSALFDHDSTGVHFVVHAGIGRALRPVGEAVLPIRVTVPLDTVAVVHHFAERAGVQLSRRLVDGEARRDRPQPAIQVQEWCYDTTEARYEVEVEMRWPGSRSDRRTAVLRGTLWVKDEEYAARFRAREASAPIALRWRRRIGEPVTRLDPLAPPAAGGRRPGFGRRPAPRAEDSRVGQ